VGERVKQNMKYSLVRKPGAGKPHAGFDERDVKTEHGEASEAPATERAGNRYAEPITTASHLDSTFGFWVDGRSPKLSPSNTPRSLRIKFEEVIDHATARHNARRKIVREDSDGRRLIIELEQIVVHACWELLSYLAS
jgi:hypothetical protein